MEIAKALESEKKDVGDHAGAADSGTPCKGSEALFGAGSEVPGGENSEEPNGEGTENSEVPEVEMLNSVAEDGEGEPGVKEGGGSDEAAPSEVASASAAAELEGSPDTYHPCNVCSGKGQAFVEQDGIWLCLVCVQQLRAKQD